MASRSSPSKSDDLIEVPKSALVALAHLARVIGPFIGPFLAEARQERQPTTDVNAFTSVDLPPELRRLKTGRRIFRTIVKRSGLGVKDGQEWSISQPNWYRIRRRNERAGIPAQSNSIELNPQSGVDALDRALEGAGLRATAGGRG